ncbi:MAG: MMPL family transporter [Gammaproteobacteria bacterium]|nr:MMPL family transporter [Gammaproteobacteria bacterium]MXY64642.1 MMPL family transporter [Gammaproteobacteria bacterium]MYG66270.1 MMPL family transporter [Gammaproteobacteria bacterium]
MTSAQLDRVFDLILRRPWVTVALASVLMIAMTAGVRYINVTNDYRILFGEHNPELAEYEALEEIYAESNRALIAVAPAQGTVFTRETLGAIEELTEAAWRAPYASRVDSLTNYSHSEAEGDDLIVEPLVDGAGSLTDDELSQVESIALNSAEITGRLVSHDGHVSGVAINFFLPDPMDPAVVEITDHLHAMLDEARARHAEIDYYLTGDVVMHRAFADATQDDLRRLMPIVFVVIVAAAAILLRSLLGTLAIVIVLMFVVNTTMGLAGWLRTEFSPTNAGVPIIVMAMTVAYAIHIVSITLLGMRGGMEKHEAIADSLRHNATPVFLTSLTTAIGFLSLNASDSPPFHVLGNLVAFGVFCAFSYCMVLLPAILSLLPLRVPPLRVGKPVFFDRLAGFVIDRRKFLLWSVSAVTIVLIMGIPRNEISETWSRYFDDRFEFRRHTDFVIENLTGLDSLEYSLSAGREGGITDPEYLHTADAFAEWLREQPEVTHVQAFPDIMKRLNRNMNGDDPAFHRLPESPELAAQYLLLYEFSLPFGIDLNDRIDVAKSATRMTAVAANLSGGELLALDDRAQAWLEANAPGMATAATGITMIFAHLSQRNIESMLQGTIIAMGLISLILILVLRNIRIGLISLLPNFIPAAMSFGLWGYLVGRVGMASSVVTVVAFGIIVDDTIHFLSKYLKARKEGLPAPEAVRYTFGAVGHALATTTVVLALGFLVFTASGFELSWALGILVSMTIVIALLTDFLLLPTLLMAIDRRK